MEKNLDLNKIQRFKAIIIKYSFNSPKQIKEDYCQYDLATTTEFQLDENKRNKDYVTEEIDFFQITKKQYESGNKTWKDVLDNKDATEFNIYNPEFAIAFISALYSEELDKKILEHSTSNYGLLNFKTRPIRDNMKQIEKKIASIYMDNEKMTMEILKVSKNPSYMIKCFNTFPENKEICELARQKFREYWKLEEKEAKNYEGYMKIENYSTKENIIDILASINQDTSSRTDISRHIYNKSRIIAQEESIKYLKDPDFTKKILELLSEYWVSDNFLLGIYKLHISNDEIAGIVNKMSSLRNISFADVASKEAILKTLKRMSNNEISADSWDLHIIESLIVSEKKDSDFIAACYNVLGSTSSLAVFENYALARYYLELPEEEQNNIESKSPKSFPDSNETPDER